MLNTALTASLVSLALSTAPQADTLSRTVDRLLSGWNHAGSPGVSVAVMRDGEILHSAGYGHAQLEYGIPITPATVFHVASVSKQFTAFAVTLLAAQGKLSLDDDIRTHLPEMADFGPTITIRHLIHHTSGLRDQWTLLSLAGWRLDDVITREDILRLARQQTELNFDPGSRYTYSNTGYTLLAEIVTRVTGQPFPEWMAENVFEPLGMTGTHFHNDHEHVVPDRSYSYYRDDDGEYRKAVLSYANVGATSLFTTAEDLTRWAQNFLEPQVGDSAVIQQMYQRGVLTGGDTISYAHGLAISERRGVRVVEHSGGDAGFRSHLLMVPEKNFAVAVLSNAAQGDPGSIANRLTGFYLAEELEPMAAAGAGPGAGEGDGEAPLEPIVDVPDAELERVAGAYWSEEANLLRRIRVEEGRLVYDRAGGNESPLAPLGDDRFLMTGVAVRVEVVFEPAGQKPQRMIVNVSGDEPMVAVAIEVFEPAAAELEVYSGQYRSAELAMDVELLVEDGGLVLRHRRHGDIPLEPMMEDMFGSSAWWLGQLRFERGANGQLTGFHSNSGRVMNLLFTRQ